MTRSRKKRNSLVEVLYSVERMDIDDVRCVLNLCKQRVNNAPIKVALPQNNLVYNSDNTPSNLTLK